MKKPLLDDPPKEAMLYDKLPGGKVRCRLCAHRCIIPDGGKGICQVRENRGGVLYTLAYGKTIAQHVDPIEKKPLFHFHPGTTAYSVAAPGCNFRCSWCQNWEISQMPRERHLLLGELAAPDEIVAAARRAGSRSIAYTYTEPTVFSEYALDTARIAHSSGLANLFITNGYMTEEMLEQSAPFLDAANVDLKAFREKTYQQYVGAKLAPVLESLKTIRRLGIWLEVTTLVIPGINDDPAELKDAAGFIAQELGPDTPWHISRFFPAYRMNDRPPTPLEKLEEAREIGRAAGLHYVYLGNAADGEDTLCPHCGRAVIRRIGNRILDCGVTGDDRCPACGTGIAGVGLGNPSAG
ncbi:MAG: AmmeMemoRadiSam system radical SAM enzyme [Anaerolineales bacterium]|nr:AmmeMemoRadiSam system radical SAM enzyme [Anaerolineales bacterium]